MDLKVRPKIYFLPSYSLTGDLIGFLRCGLQYRYTRIGNLPSANPVQMWFGDFIHGVLEEAYRRYVSSCKKGTPNLPPWSHDEVNAIIELIKKRLSARGLFPWSEDLERVGDERAKSAINEMGPELFPVIHRAEVRLTGTRWLPVERIPKECQFREADRYEMAGIIDVVTHMQLNDPALQGNRMVKGILRSLPGNLPKEFEVIIDYKGMRRPSMLPITEDKPSLWDVYSWQVQTYAELRSKQEDHLPVVAGVILYLNELRPTWHDVELLHRETRRRETDVVPETGKEEEAFLAELKRISGHGDNGLPSLPFEFRLRRALRVIPITEETTREALEKFDDVVARIETCRGRELIEGRIISSWEKNAEDESTCTACDSRTYCQEYRNEKAPRLPGIKPQTTRSEQDRNTSKDKSKTDINRKEKTSTGLSNWREINRLIGKCRQSQNPIDGLENLFRTKGDGMVAFAVGQEYAKKGKANLSLQWFAKAERLLPLLKWKIKAREEQRKMRRILEKD
mgnify:CR=1 FL=1